MAKERPVVIGVAEHAGWAHLLSVAAADGLPAVVDRRRVKLIEAGVPTQPYHHETLALPDDESEQLLRLVKRSIAASTALAFERLAADLHPQYRVSAVALREPTLPHLPKSIAEAHGSYHVQCRADGMLYHSAVCAAARQRRWKVAFHRRGEETAAAAAALKTSVPAVEQFIAELKRTLGPPWTADHRCACAAAISEMRDLSRLPNRRRR